jgi:SAM-dependent methyltransferase
MLESRPCPVCNEPAEKAELFLEENIDINRISKLTFASRKEPEFMCHRLIRCTVCDLVYASNPPNQSELAYAYHLADYDSSDEANDAARSYISAMHQIFERLTPKNRALEIGSGTGILLEMLSEKGFDELIGVEPSLAAIAASPLHRKSWLRQEIFAEENFEPESFDLICCFMTLEHMLDPMSTAAAAKRLLRPGGAFVTVTHDYRGLVNRILGERSPIIDIEHMQLFSRRSIRDLYERNGFECVQVNGFWNRYSVRYWTRLLPIRSSSKKRIIKTLELMKLANTKLKVNVGNVLSFGFVPRD